MNLIVASIILGIGAAAVAYFLTRSFLVPKRIETLAALLRQGKSQAVIKAARRLISRDARNADAHYLLGLAYDAEGNHELALMELKTVNQIGRFDGVVAEVPFREKIAALYAEFNLPEEALKEYLLLIKRVPDRSDYYRKAGLVFEERNRTDRAVQFYRKAVEVNPRDAEAHTRLGLLLYRAKRPQEARSELDTALRLDPDNHEAWYCVGRILKEAGDCVGAMSAFERSSRSPRFKARSLIERGGCLISTGSMERAIAELERAVRIAEPGTGEELHARYFLAHCFEKTRRIERAVAEWEIIQEKRPGFRDVTEKLAGHQELRTDDRMKDYLTVAGEPFQDLCKQLTEAMGLVVRDVREATGGCEVVAVENTSKWRNVRARPILVRFMRSAVVVDETAVRDTHDAVRRQGISRGVIVTSSSFTRPAEEYADSRPVDLIARDRLQSLLQQVSLL